MRRILLSLVFVALATPALAVDGVLEINQTCAESPTGCFAGDTPGLPVTINSRGSYMLTGNLASTGSNENVIEITADDVTLDLNDFTIRCSWFINPCAGTGTGQGIAGFSADNVTVRNGTVRDMPSTGIQLNAYATIGNIRAIANGQDGIDVEVSSSIRDSVAAQNGSVGISVGASSTVSGSTAYQNGGDGIRASDGTTISGNTARQNGDDGIDGGTGVTIIGNAAYGNGDATNPTLDDGITCGSGCNVRGNSVRLNSGFGLRLSTDSGYRENVVTFNTAGAVTGGVDAGANVINGVVTPTP